MWYSHSLKYVLVLGIINHSVYFSSKPLCLLTGFPGYLHWFSNGEHFGFPPLTSSKLWHGIVKEAVQRREAPHSFESKSQGLRYLDNWVSWLVQQYKTLYLGTFLARTETPLCVKLHTEHRGTGSLILSVGCWCFVQSTCLRIHPLTLPSPWQRSHCCVSWQLGKKLTLTLHQVGPDPSLKGKAIAELRPVRHPSTLTYSRCLLLHGKYC